MSVLHGTTLYGVLLPVMHENGRRQCKRVRWTEYSQFEQTLGSLIGGGWSIVGSIVSSLSLSLVVGEGIVSSWERDAGGRYLSGLFQRR